jgi:1-pyrroline-4-hydroxy-2-carboxylate deaminase
MSWTGVIPAITTSLKANGAVDHDALARHCLWLLESGCTGIVCCGSLGEAATLSFDEKLEVARTCVKAAGGRAPVVLGVAALGTAEAVALACGGEERGCKALMVLPPYVYSTDWREMKAHVSAILRATSLACMLYNNPPAYRTDFLPWQIAELAREHANLAAVKESSGDARRITAIRALLEGRVAILVGLDDALVEGVAAGASGWIAGLANAFPSESVELFAAAARGDRARAEDIYRWFLPLLRLDAEPKFVQSIKWIQAAVGRGPAIVRAPRLPLDGDAVAMLEATLAQALRQHPSLFRTASARPPAWT